jgi:hypothetical protein
MSCSVRGGGNWEGSARRKGENVGGRVEIADVVRAIQPALCRGFARVLQGALLLEGERTWWRLCVEMERVMVSTLIFSSTFACSFP